MKTTFRTASTTLLVALLLSVVTACNHAVNGEGRGTKKGEAQSGTASGTLNNGDVSTDQQTSTSTPTDTAVKSSYAGSCDQSIQYPIDYFAPAPGAPRFASMIQCTDYYSTVAQTIEAGKTICTKANTAPSTAAWKAQACSTKAMWGCSCLNASGEGVVIWRSTANTPEENRAASCTSQSSNCKVVSGT